MTSLFNKIKEFAKEGLFPRKCLGCQKEGSFLCDDCLFLIDISPVNYCLCQKPKILEKNGKCPACFPRTLDGIYNAAPYADFLVKKAILLFKYEPFIKNLSQPLTQIILNHFCLLKPTPSFTGYSVVNVPLDKKRQRWRGFNQAEELALKLTANLNLPMVSNCLVKDKNTAPQAQLAKNQRIVNLSNVFSCQKPEAIKGKKLLLVDDVFTTGATMEECAKALKAAGAKKVFAVSVARG